MLLCWMPECPTCGNPIEDFVSNCPFCERPVTGGSRRAAHGRMVKVVNLESGMPTVAEAEDRLHREIDTARGQGVRVLKIIHGYGSSGVGGGIGRMVRSVGRRLVSGRIVKSMVPGEHFDGRAADGQELVRRFPRLKKDGSYGRGNMGITFLVI